MDFESVILILNGLLNDKNPETFNSTWILRNTTRCYRFIQKNVRSNFWGIDWDRITGAIEWKFQRRWNPGRKQKSKVPYKSKAEVNTVLRKYKNHLYVFVAPADIKDRRIRDMISISLVRLAQRGNLLAKEEIIKLASYTVNDWLERYYFLARWQGYEEEIRNQIEGCIRRYRYTGSFMTYVFRTLEYAGRGIRPFYAYSLDEPAAFDAEKRKIDNVVQDPDTNKALIYNKI